MTRQDEFLRMLLRVAQANRRDKTQDYGLRLIEAAIEERLPHLKPVAYENRDLSSGFSTDGVVVCGDRASIQRVQLAFHNASNVDSFWRPAHARMSQQLAAVRSALSSGD